MYISVLQNMKHKHDSSGVVPKDPERFWCPFAGCNRSFAELWRLKVHYRAPPDIRGSGKERGHGTELTHCPKCGKQLKPGKHHVGCSAGKTAPRQANKRSRVSSDSSQLEDGSTPQHEGENPVIVPMNGMQPFFPHMANGFVPHPQPMMAQLTELHGLKLEKMDANGFMPNSVAAAPSAGPAAQHGYPHPQPIFPPSPALESTPFAAASYGNGSLPTHTEQHTGPFGQFLGSDGGLHSVFDYDEHAHDRVPSPPPLPADFPSNNLLFNFSQFNKKMPMNVQVQVPLVEGKGTASASNGKCSTPEDSGTGTSMTYDQSSDGDIMQLLFGAPDEYPDMATIHIHQWQGGDSCDDLDLFDIDDLARKQGLDADENFLNFAAPVNKSDTALVRDPCPTGAPHLHEDDLVTGDDSFEDLFGLRETVLNTADLLHMGKPDSQRRNEDSCCPAEHNGLIIKEDMEAAKPSSATSSLTNVGPAPQNGYNKLDGQFKNGAVDPEVLSLLQPCE